MSSEPRISVIIPVHNGEPYIRSAVESVLSQTYPASEIVILENASTDSTLDTLRTFSDPRLRIISSKQFLNIYENWHRILELDLAEYMTVLGHDDRFSPNFLSEVSALIMQYPDASLYHTHFDLIDSEGERIRPCLPMPERETGDDYMRSIQHLRRDSYGTGFVVRSAEYKQVGGLPSFPKLMYADHIAWYRLATLHGIVSSPKYLFEYRRHEQSAGSQTNLVDLYHASKQYMLALANSDYFKSSENTALTKSYVEYSFNGHCHRKLVDLIYHGTSEDLKAFRAIKAQFMAEAERDQLFNAYDSASKIYERIAAIPVPLIRKLLLQPIEVIRSYRQHRRENP